MGVIAALVTKTFIAGKKQASSSLFNGIHFRLYFAEV
jgi:hypothetical protein